ncbi:MAG: RrF2 family transcriptional regulator [Thermoleophilia bacterium]
MFRVSLKADYAIKALVRLALATESKPVQAHDIAEFGVIPAKFLEQVMHDLRQAGYVHSKRGKRGGYVLARAAADISFAEVIDTIDGTHDAGARMRLGDQAERLVQPVWREVNRCLRLMLEQATIAAAAERAAQAPMYYI